MPIKKHPYSKCNNEAHKLARALVAKRLPMNEQIKTEQAWSVKEQVEPLYDPLLLCLAIFTKIHGHPVSTASLSAGLPLANNLLTPQLFIKAAKRAKLSARIVKRPLQNISNLLLPVVLLLKDNDACIVLELDKKTDLAKVIMPETGEGEAILSCQILEKRYLGYAIFIKPEHQYDERTPTQETKTGNHWFWGTIASSWRIYRDVLIASVFVNLFALASPLFIMNVYDRVVPNQAFETLWVLGIGVTVVFVFDLLFRVLRSYFIDIAGKKADIILSSMIYEKVVGLRMDQRPASIGAFANNLGEFENIRNFITSATMTTLVDLPFVFLFLGVIFYIGGPAVLVPLTGIPIILIYGLMVQKPIRTAVEQVMRTSAQKNATLIETLMGSETIKAMCAEGQLQKKWEQAIGNIAHWSVRSRLLSTSTTNMAVFMQQLATMGVVTYGVYLAANNEISLGGLIAVVILTSRAMAPMALVANITAHFHEARNALKTLNGIMALKAERESSIGFVHRTNIQGNIEFSAVNFTYTGQPFNAVNNLSFKINHGERVGIIGRTGSGKSTLQKLLMGLYKPASGMIKLDNIDIQQMDPFELRKCMGYVPQDVMLFYGSLRDNIAFGTPHIESEQLLKAAELAGVTEFSSQHPMGLDMPLGERGEALSGGQRQSVIIARALLHEPSIMVMDEPSNSMDNTTEEKLLAHLEVCLKGKTLLLVTHRASMLKLVDRILVIEKGHIIADGPKDVVINAMKDGSLGMRT